MSERSERVANFVQILLYAAVDGGGPPIMPRMYRSVLFDALAENRKALPRDLGALSLVLQAAELFGQGLFFARGSTQGKAFVGDGFHEFTLWVLRCAGLFSRVDEVWEDLPPMPVQSGDVHGVAKSFALQCDDLYENIIARSEVDAKESSEDGTPVPPTLFVDGRIIKQFITALGVVMCAWFDKPRTLRVMEAVNEGKEELFNCRVILEDEPVRGNA